MFKRLFGGAPPDFITVVSGLPRSGTSMMMRMLEAGGVAPLQDGERTADRDNPRGYYEFERVKGLDKGDSAWLPQAQGKAVKIISLLLQHLPATYPYRVVFMRRDLDEVLASQARMLQHRQEEAASDDERLKLLYSKHLRQIEAWLAAQPHMRLHFVDYRLLVSRPLEQLPAVANFLGGRGGHRLDVNAMAAVADPTLYRNRA